MIEVEVFGDAQGIAPADVQRLAIAAAASVGVEHGHVAVEFVDAARIAELNGAHRDRPAPTDVLSFPVDGADSLQGVQSIGGANSGRSVPRELGDVLICPEHAVDLREAVVHGVLHLVGMDHETDEGEMLDVQRRLLAEDSG